VEPDGIGQLGRITRARARLPANVRALGWVSFANDFASELAYPVTPLFLTATLGAPVAVIGLIEGIAEGVAVGLRGVAGVLSDRTRRRVPWIVAGYSLSAVARPVVAAAPAWGWVLAGRLVDRLGKAGRKRHMGWRPTVRGSAMTPRDHPHGGGEGRSPIGMPGPKTPWGKPALGYKTRKPKASDRMIVKRRGK